MTTKTDIEQERRDFEESMRIGGYKNLDLIKDNYEDQEVDAAWLGWKLRAALQSRGPAEQTLAELVDKIIPGLDTGDLLADAQQASAALQSQDREDSARLDWIEMNARRDPDMGGNHTWWPTSFNKTIRGPSLRDAIDNARRVGGES